MRFGRLIKVAALNLKAARQRSLLAVLGIVIGIASVIAMVSLGTIARVEALRQFQLLGTDIVTLQISPQPRPIGRVTLDDLRAIPRRIPAVARVAPRVDGQPVVRYRTSNEPRGVFGVDPDERFVSRLSVREGRFIAPLDAGRRVAVLTAKLAAALSIGGPAIQVGEWIRVAGQPFKVIGILNPKDVGSFGDARLSEGMYVDLESMMRINGSTEVAAATLQFPPGVPPSLAAAQVRSKLSEWHGEAAEFQTFVPEELLRQMEGQLRLMTLLLGIVASISLVVGGVGVMNVMLVSVTERRKEIGVRRALGARRRDVQLLFLAEAVLLTIVGGACGAVLGIGSAYVVSMKIGWQPFIPFAPVALGIAVAATLGMFFGWYPSRKAAAMLPIEAMRA